jgi:hypothetical protein
MNIETLIRDAGIIVPGRLYGLFGNLCGRAAARGVCLTVSEKRFLSLTDKYKGRRAFIIGNGPSLHGTDLRLLKDEITIGCNGLFLMFDGMGFLPTFYTVEDNLVAEDRADRINNIRGTTKIIPYDLRYRIKPDGDTVYVNFVRRYAGFPRFSTCGESVIYWGGTVTYLNMQLAYHLGISTAYLVGMDHNYVVPKADNRDGSVITSKTPDGNHFHPDYFGPGYRYHDPRVDRMEEGYKTAREYFEKDNRNIFNATSGGRLEVFKRVDYLSLFS